MLRWRAVGTLSVAERVRLMQRRMPAIKTTGGTIQCNGDLGVPEIGEDLGHQSAKLARERLSRVGK
jgi:hypothetical protein